MNFSREDICDFFNDRPFFQRCFPSAVEGPPQSSEDGRLSRFPEWVPKNSALQFRKIALGDAY
jgi:hypothetical protein